MFNWNYHDDKYYPNLSKWECQVGHLSISIRYVLGCDFNVQQEQQNESKRLYEYYIGFRNYSDDTLLALNVNGHVLSGNLYRNSYDECKAVLKSIVNDLIVVIQKD